MKERLARTKKEELFEKELAMNREKREDERRKEEKRRIRKRRGRTRK